MSAESAADTTYYDYFTRGGWDLSLMAGALKTLDMPGHILDSLRHVPTATFLVLGSAAVRNIDNVAILDNHLRPGQGDKDHTMMIDYNHYPLTQHRKKWGWMEPLTRTEEQKRHLPYPTFNFVQADMRQLPFPDKSYDAVISDYTLNFLSTEQDVAQTFRETARVLKPDGLMLLAVAGHEDVDPTIPPQDLPNTEPQLKARFGNLVTVQFPLQVYEQSAAAHGLTLQAANTSGNDYLCAVLQKFSH
jgi:SAM-dependent methyltransferase